ELRLMHVLWKKGRGTVGDVWSGLSASKRPAYNSVQTLLRILEDKGFVRHEQEGRAFVYVPAVGKAEARETAISRLVGQFFDGDAGLLALNLVERGDVDEHELVRLKRLIRQQKGR
ncbi:MAG TPA: BlaI/MecI/CopY family transcriptional regulator, partial [Vicinamibacterales bacterium]|nr:BlaI/MecI/CopY family transcriptional regulator [Vicinamibacterales bacterium]